MQEILQAFALGIFQEFCRISLFHNVATIDKHQMVGNIVSKMHFVSDDDHCHTLFSEILGTVRGK